MKTDKQISNAHSRAAQKASEAAHESQKINFAATDKDLASERGSAMTAAGFAASALAHLENGNYARFLTCMRLSGDFAKDADFAHSKRTPVNPAR